MALSAIAGAAVLRAIAEYDRLGQEEFLDCHGFGRARSYCLAYEGKSYDLTWLTN